MRSTHERGSAREKEGGGWGGRGLKKNEVKVVHTQECVAWNTPMDGVAACSRKQQMQTSEGKENGRAATPSFEVAAEVYEGKVEVCYASTRAHLTFA